MASTVAPRKRLTTVSIRQRLGPGQLSAQGPVWEFGRGDAHVVIRRIGDHVGELAPVGPSTSIEVTASTSEQRHDGRAVPKPGRFPDVRHHRRSDTLQADVETDLPFEWLDREGDQSGSVESAGAAKRTGEIRLCFARQRDVASSVSGRGCSTTTSAADAMAINETLQVGDTAGSPARARIIEPPLGATGSGNRLTRVPGPASCACSAWNERAFCAPRQRRPVRNVCVALSLSAIERPLSTHCGHLPSV